MLQILQRRSPLIAPAELLQRPDETLLFILCLGHPELFPVLHDIGQDGTTEEDHVFSTRGIFDSDFEVLLKQREHSALCNVDFYSELTCSRLASPPSTLVR